METAWYFRLFWINISWFIISWLLFYIIKAKRMSGPGPSRPLVLAYWASFVTGWVLTWFVHFSLNLAFWTGIGIIISGQVVFALGYLAMREHPEKKQAVVDWGIYRFSRHSHVLAGTICLLGVIVAGWSPQSTVYIILWVYFVAQLILTHFGVVNEEKSNIARFGQDYVAYMKRVPRYFLVKG